MRKSSPSPNVATSLSPSAMPPLAAISPEAVTVVKDPAAVVVAPMTVPSMLPPLSVLFVKVCVPVKVVTVLSMLCVTVTAVTTLVIPVPPVKVRV